VGPKEVSRTPQRHSPAVPCHLVKSGLQGTLETKLLVIRREERNPPRSKSVATSPLQWQCPWPAVRATDASTRSGGAYESLSEWPLNLFADLSWMGVLFTASEEAVAGGSAQLQGIGGRHGGA
jgi:hypothetical protein